MNLQNFGKNMAASLKAAAIRAVTGNETTCRQMATDIVTQLSKNIKRLQCDGVYIELFDNGRSLGFKDGYGWFEIDKGQLLKFDMLPPGIITFDRLASFIPKTERIKNGFPVLTVGFIEDKLNLTVSDRDTKDIIVNSPMEDYLFKCLFHSPEQQEQIVKEFEGLEILGVGEETEPEG